MTQEQWDAENKALKEKLGASVKDSEWRHLIGHQEESGEVCILDCTGCKLVSIIESYIIKVTSKDNLSDFYDWEIQKHSIEYEVEFQKNEVHSLALQLVAVRGALEKTVKSLEGFKYLDNGQPKEMDLVEYAKLVGTIYGNGLEALNNAKETLSTPPPTLVAQMEKKMDIAESQNVNEYLCSCDRGKFMRGDCIVCTVEKRSKSRLEAAGKMAEALKNLLNFIAPKQEHLPKVCSIADLEKYAEGEPPIPYRIEPDGTIKWAKEIEDARAALWNTSK